MLRHPNRCTCSPGAGYWAPGSCSARRVRRRLALLRVAGKRARGDRAVHSVAAAVAGPAARRPPHARLGHALRRNRTSSMASPRPSRIRPCGWRLQLYCSRAWPTSSRWSCTCARPAAGRKSGRAESLSLERRAQERHRQAALRGQRSLVEPVQHLAERAHVARQPMHEVQRSLLRQLQPPPLRAPSQRSAWSDSSSSCNWCTDAASSRERSLATGTRRWRAVRSWSRRGRVAPSCISVCRRKMRLVPGRVAGHRVQAIEADQVEVSQPSSQPGAAAAGST